MRYTDETLAALRSQGDPVPDRIIDELAAGGQLDAGVLSSLGAAVAEDGQVAQD